MYLQLRFDTLRNKEYDDDDDNDIRQHICIVGGVQCVCPLSMQFCVQ